MVGSLVLFIVVAGPFAHSSCLALIIVLQFRNQYDNDITTWSPQVRPVFACERTFAGVAPMPTASLPASLSRALRGHDFILLFLKFRRLMCVGAHPSGGVCDGGRQTGELPFVFV
jgi:hypothetical protein